MHARVLAVESLVFFVREERRAFTEARKVAHMTAPGHRGGCLEQAGIAQDRRHDVLQHEADAVGHLAAHQKPVFRNGAAASRSSIG